MKEILENWIKEQNEDYGENVFYSLEMMEKFAEYYHNLQLHKTQVSGSDILEVINESMQLIDYMHQLTVIPDNLMEDYANRFANTMSLLATLRNHYR